MRTFIFALFLLQLFVVTFADSKPLAKRPKLLTLPGLVIEEPDTKPKIVSDPNAKVELTFVDGSTVVITPTPAPVFSFRQLGFNSAPAQNLVTSTNFGLTRVSNPGVVIKLGTKANIPFKAQLGAINANALANADASFRRSLSIFERREYDDLKSRYNGGLNIPFVEYIQNRIQVVGGSSSPSNRLFRLRLNRQITEARNILRQFINTRTEVTGNVIASNIGDRAETVFAFVRVAILKLDDGGLLTVISSNPRDVIAADAGGSPAGISGRGTISFANVVDYTA